MLAHGPARRSRALSAAAILVLLLAACVRVDPDPAHGVDGGARDHDAAGNGAPRRVRACCVDSNDCGPGQTCSGGRCWSPLATPPCDTGQACSHSFVNCDGAGCVAHCGCGPDRCETVNRSSCVDTGAACGYCLEDHLACHPDCGADLGATEVVSLTADPPTAADPFVFAGTIVSADSTPDGSSGQFEVQAADGARQGFRCSAAGVDAFGYLGVGFDVRVEIVGRGLPVDRRVTTVTRLPSPFDDEESTVLVFVDHRGADPFDADGFPFHIEDVRCDATLVEACLRASPAVVVFNGVADQIDGHPVPRSMVLQTGEDERIDLPAERSQGRSRQARVRVGRVYREQNACDPGLDDLYANFLLYPNEH